MRTVPMDTLQTITVEDEDINAARRGVAEDPFVHALQRTLGSRWTRGELRGVALETRTPFRAIVLPIEVTSELDKFKTTGKMKPSTYNVDIFATSEFVHSVVQHSVALQQESRVTGPIKSPSRSRAAASRIR